MARTMGKLPKGAIVPVGTHGSRSRTVIRYRDRRTGQLLSREHLPRRSVRHPRTGRFITKTEDTMLKGRPPRSVRSSRGRALAFVRVSPKARGFYDGLPQRWQRHMVAAMGRALRDGLEPRVAARVAIRDTIRTRREAEAERTGGAGD